MQTETDYSGYKECGCPEYRNSDAGPQLNECEHDNYAGASAAHAAINTTDLPRAIENIDQARDNYDATWKAVQDANQAVKDAQAAADQAEIAWGDASATLQRFERDAVAARAAGAL
jgi:hypothetical protein